MAPTIVFVPGFWVGSSPFAHVASLLRSEGYPTYIAVLSSTGTQSPGNPSMKDDIAALRSTVEKLVDEEKDVVLILHSGGGFLCSNAIEGLGVKARNEKGLKGGVSKIVFVTAAVFPEGFKHGQLPFAVYEGGAMYCVTPEKLLFSDLSTADAEKWTKELQMQPAAGWDDTVTYCGWKDVPSVYLVCEGDLVIPQTMQLQMAELAGSTIERCAAGHMPMLSMPEKVVEVVKNAVQAT